MHCTLLIPGLFWTRELAELALRDVELPALSQLLARAEAQRFAAITPEGWLCQAFEVERQRDWPVAPLTLALDGGEVGDAFWVRADPVHLKVEGDGLTLVDSTGFGIQPEEAQALIEPIAAHFATDGIHFSAPHPKRWYASFERAPDAATRSVREVAGRNVDGYLPQGPDALRCNRVFNEAQMLLHEHAVNLAREERGEPPVNSIWLWGGGTRPAVPARPFDAVWSDDLDAQALGVAADAHAAGLPAGAAEWLAHGAAHGRTHLLALHELATAAAYHELEAWRDRLAAFESRWFAPLLRALTQGRLAGCALVVPAADACWRFDVARSDLLKIWRRPKPVWSYG